MENSASTLAYTIKVDGIEDLLTQLGRLEKSVADLDKDFENIGKGARELKGSLDEVGKANKTASDSANDHASSSKKVKDEQDKLLAALRELAKALKDNAKGQDDLKKSQEELASKSDKTEAALQKNSKAVEDNAKAAKNLAVELKSTGKAMDEPKDKAVGFSGAFTKSMGEVKKSIGDAAEGIEAMKKVAGDLNVSALQGYSKEFEKVSSAVGTGKAAMEGFSLVIQTGNTVVGAAKAAYALANEMAVAYASGTGVMTIAQATFNAVAAANPLGALVAAIAAVVAVGIGLVSMFSGNTKASEELNKSLEGQDNKFNQLKDSRNKDIEIMKASGKSEEEISQAKEDLIRKELELRQNQQKEAARMLAEASNSQKAEIAKKAADLKASEELLSKDLELTQKERANKQLELDHSALDKLRELQTANIKDRQQRERQELIDRQNAETADFEKRFKNAADYDKLLAAMQQKHAQETQQLTAKFADENSAIKLLNDSISKLTDKAMNELILKGNISDKTMASVAEKTIKLQEAQRKFQEQLESSPKAIEAQRKALERQMQQEELAYKRKLELNQLEEKSDEEKKDAEIALTKASLEARLGMLRELYGKTGSYNEREQREFEQLTKSLAALNAELKKTGDAKTAAAKAPEIKPAGDIDQQTIKLKAFGGVLAGIMAAIEAKQGQGKKGTEKASNPLLSAAGLDAEGEKKLKEGLQMAEQAISAASQSIGAIFEAQKEHKLHAIQEEEDRQIANVENSTLSEAEKAKKIDAIKKDAADKAHKTEIEEKKKKQKLDIITGIINTALAVTQALAGTPPPASYVMAAIAAATGAIQVGIVASQQFAKGGIIPFSEGGMIQGASHAEGGVPFTSGGISMEAEGGELIVNRGIWQRPDFVRTISEMNAFTGGKRFFAAGGVVPTPSVPGVFVSPVQTPQGFDTKAMMKGLRGVIAQEVGSLKVVNNVVDTTDQQTRILNQQANSTF